ncbi:hypothetical protein QN277_020328 [Acacia crassicarpa]|uniref:Uncharacterized protein n=1 Tax=Acacia crassicarpa TaxID=499986 RepID=A0AAE1KCX6_9FABA|nr:hypothetical protein QN277_020328 [Acacia crassicarpa]
MADQQQKTSSADSKEGTSQKEEDIGKEFLSSWKSISMTDDDAMDFNFDSVTKGKKKTFNFGKLDMDFNLDGEFDKISSFKMDMSDLDFSCSPKKPSKSKENKGGGCSGAKEGRGHSFDFNFDFNEMDSFNLDSSLLKGDKASTLDLTKKGVTSHKIDSEVAKEPETNNNEHVHASNVPMILKPLSSETVETSKVGMMVGDQKDLDFIQGDSAPKALSSGKLDMLVEARSSTLSTEEKDQKREIPMKRHTSESISEDIHNPPSQSIDHIVSNQDSITGHTEFHTLGTRIITGSGGKQSVINNKATYVDPDGVKSPLEISSTLEMKNLESVNEEDNAFGSNNQVEDTNDPHPVNNDSSFENNTSEDVSKKVLLDNEIKENQSSTSEGHLATASSGSSKPVVDEEMLMKDREIKGMQSKFFCKTGESVPLKQNSLTFGKKEISFDYKKTGDMHLGSMTKARESFKSDDSGCGTRLVSDSTPPTTKSVRDELVSIDGKHDIKIPSNAMKGIISDGTQSGGKLAETKQPILKEVKKSKITLLETSMSSKDVHILSSHVHPSCLTEKTARHANKVPVNLQAQNSDKELLKNLRVTGEENKLSSIKAFKIGGFKTAKGVETDKALPTPIRQKETESPANSENMKMRGITAAKIDNLIDSSANQKPATPFLKRKNTNEVSEADLAPLRSLKRLHHSPSEIRNSKGCAEKVVGKVESRSNSLLCNIPTLELPRPPEINLVEVKLPTSALVVDNSNVEKAEAYTKELEDICNMLKKKHEEAKELIVRAVVNNNNLLMLNHPIYEEKFRKVQKLALHLMSKEIQT